MNALRRPSRIKRYVWSILVLVAIDVAMTLLFGSTGVTGFQIAVAAFIATWLNEEIPA